MSEAIGLSIDSKGRINISKDIIVDIYIFFEDQFFSLEKK